MVIRVPRRRPLPHPIVREHHPAPAWFPNWTGQTAILVASGPSAKTVDLESVRDRARFIAINSSWRLAPWADVLYACDEQWWSEHKGAPEFAGLKVSQDRRAAQRFPDVQFIRSERQSEVLIMDVPGVIGWGGNSGFHAINLAAKWKPAKIILVGYDMHLDAGLHWHGAHTGRCTNPVAHNVPRWRRVVDEAYATLKSLGIPAFNVSPNSALLNYPKCSLDEAMSA